MSATMLDLSDLIAHVPVDKFTIVNGPTSARCMKVMEELTSQEYFEQLFTLTTPASTSSFRRTLRIATVFDIQRDGSFTFTGIFSGRIVSGVYSPNKRQGWFTLD